MPAESGTAPGWRERLAQRSRQWSPTTRGLLWALSSGVLFSVMNALMRGLTLNVEPAQAQFLRYGFGLLVLLPLVAKRGLAHYRPHSVAGQFARGAAHTLGLTMWFAALPKIPLADMTAIGFTTPIFILIGAALFFREPFREKLNWERWLAVGLGFVGVLCVVGPKLSGSGGGWHLLMLASSPVFAASFLLTKSLTRHESAGVILLWQALTVTLLSLPMAWVAWQPIGATALSGFALCGLLGSGAHYCITRSIATTDISATQSARFLDLVWAALLGWLLFTDVPSANTLIGGAVICAATFWVARREAARLR